MGQKMFIHFAILSFQHRPSRLKEKFSNVSFSKDPETGDTVRIDSPCEARVDTSTA